MIHLTNKRFRHLHPEIAGTGHEANGTDSTVVSTNSEHSSLQESNSNTDLGMSGCESKTKAVAAK